MSNRRQPLLFLSWTALAALTGLACNDPDLNGSSSPSSTGGGSSSGFVNADLVGDWLAVLVPENPLKDDVVAYWRIDESEVLFAACNSIGGEFALADSLTSYSVSAEGDVQVVVEHTGSIPDPDKMDFVGVLNESTTLISGSFILEEDADVATEGTFTAVRSIGLGHYSPDMVEGSWAGIGTKDSGKTRDVNIQIGTDGTVLGGDMEDHVFEVGGPNTGVYQFSDTAVGRLDDVVMRSTDGSTQTLFYLLMDDSGRILGGPGFDTELGNGVLFLERQEED